MDENNFYRANVRNGEKTGEIKIPHKSDKKAFRSLLIHVSPAEIVHQIKQGDSWVVLDRWTQPGTNLSSGKFGFYSRRRSSLAGKFRPLRQSEPPLKSTSTNLRRQPRYKKATPRALLRSKGDETRELGPPLQPPD